MIRRNSSGGVGRLLGPSVDARFSLAIDHDSQVLGRFAGIPVQLSLFGNIIDKAVRFFELFAKHSSSFQNNYFPLGLL